MVTLRKLNIEDLPFLLELRNDESTRANLGNNSTFTKEESEKWFMSLTSPWYIVMVNSIKVGYIRTNGYEVGCDIHPNFRRRGYSRGAYVKYLENKEYATLWVFEDNFAKNLYLELGFTPTGDFEILRERKYIKMKYGNLN